MKKKSTSTLVIVGRFGEAGFFNLHVLLELIIVFGSILLVLLGVGTFSDVSAQANVGSTASTRQQEQQATDQQVGQTTVIRPIHSDLSRPLRDQPVERLQVREEREAHVHPRVPIRHLDRPDPVIQSSFWQPLAPPSVPTPIRHWQGISKPCDGCSYPPDTSGAVGKTQYVELASIDALQVFDKLTGRPLLRPGPITMHSLWSGFGGACESGPSGDPVVLYDQLADRWIITQFATPSGADLPQDECIAVSQTGDATGRWYRYGFHLSNRFVDYMKFGVWPDGYYMAGNMYATPTPTPTPTTSPTPSPPPPTWLGPQAFVFDRAKMLVGDPNATVQTRGITENANPFLPSHLDGILPPPRDDPNHFISFPEEETPPPRKAESLSGATPRPTPTATPAPVYRVWAFHVDWNQPANTTFTPEARISGSGFISLCETCVPQRGTTSQLDTLSGTLMFRNAYRRFPDGHESLLNNFTVSANSVAGIRWFELQRTLGRRWIRSQESTYQPDNAWRWIGSIASDNQGNIALGFNASSNAIYPQIRYAGRLAADPLNILSGEQHLFDGTGSQLETRNRWGDYSDMTVDPMDDCTFYYASEYYAATRSEFWRTRVGYFRFTQCTAPPKGTGHFVVTVCDQGTLVGNALVTIDSRPYGATLADGTYDPVLPLGQHTYLVSNPQFVPQSGSFTITNGQTALVQVCLTNRRSD